MLYLYRGFLYYLINIYLLIISGSTIKIIENAIYDPLSIPSLLASAIASVSDFFTQYFIMKLFLNLPFMLSRLVPLLAANFSIRCTNERKLTLRNVLTGPLAHVSLCYGVDVPDVLYVTTIVLLYWVITPIIAIIAALYFAGLYIITKYQLLYVYVPSYQAGGEFFYMMYKYTMIALFISSLSLIGYMGIKQAPLPAILLIPQPFIILLSWWYTEKRYKLISENTALSTIADRDRPAGSEGSEIKVSLISNEDKHVETSKQAVLHFKPEFYKQPILNERNAKILPYRINNEPIFDNKKELSPVYYDAIADLGHDLETYEISISRSMDNFSYQQQGGGSGTSASVSQQTAADSTIAAPEASRIRAELEKMESNR